MNWTELADNGVHLIALSGDIDLQHSPKMRLLLQEFGMSPSSRSRVTAAPVDHVEESPLARLLRMRGER